jgi:jumonji domain-containing protein 7
VFFRNVLGDKAVTVAVTPNGYADGIGLKDNTEYFVLPEEKEMKMEEFLDTLDQKR